MIPMETYELNKKLGQFKDTSLPDEGCSCECHPRTGQGWVHCIECKKELDGWRNHICEDCIKKEKKISCGEII